MFIDYDVYFKWLLFCFCKVSVSWGEFLKFLVVYNDEGCIGGGF